MSCAVTLQSFLFFSSLLLSSLLPWHAAYCVPQCPLRPCSGSREPAAVPSESVQGKDTLLDSTAGCIHSNCIDAIINDSDSDNDICIISLVLVLVYKLITKLHVHANTNAMYNQYNTYLLATSFAALAWKLTTFSINDETK